MTIENGAAPPREVRSFFFISVISNLVEKAMFLGFGAFGVFQFRLLGQAFAGQDTKLSVTVSVSLALVGVAGAIAAYAAYRNQRGKVKEQGRELERTRRRLEDLEDERKSLKDTLSQVTRDRGGS